ncbi:MAG TPA: hypothetical protein VFS43_08875 [Polyangiaceae bacterium]|nr:hypothetical protein [Polyangiaceae bacterium]
MRAGGEGVGRVAAEDERGPVGVVTSAEGPGLVASLERPSAGALRVRYDVRATSDPHARPGEVVVAEDRFRGDGERLVLVPTGFEAIEAEVTVTIEGESIEAPDAASSLGGGRARTRPAYGGALGRAFFLAGSLGRARFDDGIDHDEGAWLGYTAFDPRPAIAEVAQVRTALRELWGGGGEPEHALFFVSTRRPAGSYALAGRASSLVVYLGPSEPWSAPLRVGIAQHLMRAWVGGELRLQAPEAAGGAGAAWFSEGVSRYLAARALGRLGLLGPGDVQGFMNGLLAAQATSALRGRGNADAAALAERDAAARAHLAAKGALYAARVDAALRSTSRGARSIDDVVRALLQRAREARGRPLPAEAWLDAVAGELGPGERRAFDEQIVAGRDVVPPPGALGRCFRTRSGDYAAFALGFDAAATFESPGRVVAGLDPRGPAAAAGLRESDVIDEVSFRDGDAGAPAVVAVARGGQKATLRYLPRGRSGRGPRFERVPGLGDAACAPVL